MSRPRRGSHRTPGRAWTTLVGALLAALAPLAEAQDAPDSPDQAPAPRQETPKDAQSAVVRIEVVVTAVSGGSVYLDKGKAAQIEPGDQLDLAPLGRPRVPGIVRSVSRNSARAELPPGTSGIQVGDRGEVLVPEARIRAASAAESQAVSGNQPPEHPPWTADPPAFDPNQPLLAPAFGKPPEEQPMKVYGRLFAQFNGTWDSEHGNDYRLWRTGAEVTAENLFGDGGTLHVDGEVFQRESLPDNGDDETTARGRLDRASYLWGGTREDPNRVQVGRFLQHAFPELGLLDGVEVAHRTDSGGNVGASFGYMPEPTSDLRTGHDLQAAVFWRSTAEPGRPLDVGVALQNTWHDGERDRNLVVGTLDARPAEDVTLNFETVVDYYGSGDSLKRDGFQVTEARAQGRWRLSKDGGVGLHASEIRYPESRTAQYADLSPDLVENGEVKRVGVDGWRQLDEHLRVDGRVDWWQDQNDSGNSASARASLRDVLWERGDVAMDLFVTSAAFSDGQGVRLSASRAFETIGFGTLSWELSNYTNDTLTESTDLVQQAVRASLDTSLGHGWNMSTFAEWRYGDSQGSATLGIFLQQRF